MKVKVYDLLPELFAVCGSILAFTSAELTVYFMLASAVAQLVRTSWHYANKANVDGEQ